MRILASVVRDVDAVVYQGELKITRVLAFLE